MHTPEERFEYSNGYEFSAGAPIMGGGSCHSYEVVWGSCRRPDDTQTTIRRQPRPIHHAVSTISTAAILHAAYNMFMFPYLPFSPASTLSATLRATVICIMCQL
jgi:hypothetical protein